MIRVVAGICLRDKKILMGLRFADDGFYGSHWEFPGGKVENFETEEQALRREFKEELGVSVNSCEFFRQVEWKYPDKSVQLLFYFVKLEPFETEKFEKNSHAELKWFNREEAQLARVLPANRDLLDLIPF